MNGLGFEIGNPGREPVNALFGPGEFTELQPASSEALIDPIV